MPVYCIKAKEVGKKRWKFLTSKGGVNNLRIHAVNIATKDRAEALAKEINEGNVGKWEARVEVFCAD